MVRIPDMNISRTTRTFTTLCLKFGVACASFALFISSLCSQEVPPAQARTNPQNQPLSATQPLSADSLRQLLSPIALYPDALIALILPASTVPSDVELASRYVAGNGDPKQIPNQSWDNSAQSLASYPDVVTWMAQNIEWTTSLGQAFLVQPSDVMNAIQLLRAQAQAAGNLVNTPQQVIVKEKTFIRIVPAEPEYLYVPQYDPEIVYVRPYSQDYGPLITFGIGFAVGSWLNYDFDWNRHQIYRGDWQPGWNDSGYGNGGNNIVNVVNINQNTAQPWQASSRSRQQLTQQQQGFQPTSNNLGNAQVPLGVAVATANGAGQTVRQVPRPSRANFGNRGAGNRNSAASAQQPSATTTQPAAGAASVIQPTTPPNVAGQKGKPIRNLNNANVGQNVNKRSQRPGKNGAQPLPTTVQAPQNSAPGQVGNVPAASTSKNRRGTPDTSGRVPQPTQAPLVDQNGRTQSTAAQPATSGKRNQRASASLQKQAAPAVNQTQPSSASSGKNSARKTNNPDRPNNPSSQIQNSQSAAGNNRPQQKAQGPSNQPQQPSQAPKKHSTESKANNPAPRQQPQQQQPRQQQKPQQQPSSGGKHQEQKAAPAPKQNPAPAAQAQSKPAGKKSDKKKDETKAQ